MEIELLDEPEVAAPTQSHTAIALAVVSTQVAARDAIESGFAEIEKRYKDVVYDVTTTKGMDDAKKARAVIRQVRFNIQNATKETNSHINTVKADFSLASDRLIERIFLTETPIDEQIKTEEDRKAVEKAAKEQAEREQAEKIQARINALVFDINLAGANSVALNLAIDALGAVEVSLEVFGVRAGEAMQTKLLTMEQLGKLHASALAAEMLRDSMAEQQKTLDAQRKKFDDEQASAVAARIAEDLRLAGVRAADEKRIADQRAKLDADMAITRQAEQYKIDAEQKAKQDKLDSEAALVREAAEVEQKRLDDLAAIERKWVDDLAAVERKRLDDIAAAERAEASRLAAEQHAIAEKATADDKRLRDAAPNLLAALRELVDTYEEVTPDRPCVKQGRAAINQATGEKT